MTHFTIDTDNGITAHQTAVGAKALEGAERFSSEAALTKLAANWPVARLVEIYNTLTGVTPVTKFKDRKTAAMRIWKAIQTLGQPGTGSQELGAKQQGGHKPEHEQPSAAEQAPGADTSTNVAPQSPDVAREGAPARKKGTRTKKASAAKKAMDVRTARAGSKTETIVGLMKQPGGTTLNAIMEETQWLAHSVRGFISGTLGKKMGLTVISAKGESGERTYSIQP